LILAIWSIKLKNSILLSRVQGLFGQAYKYRHGLLSSSPTCPRASVKEVLIPAACRSVAGLSALVASPKAGNTGPEISLLRDCRELPYMDSIVYGWIPFTRLEAYAERKADIYYPVR